MGTEPGTGVLTFHESNRVGQTSCDQPLWPGTEISIASGDRMHVFLSRPSLDEQPGVLLLPFGN